MVINMNEAKLETIEQIREFLAGTAGIAFSVPTEAAKRRLFVATVLRRFRYLRLQKGNEACFFRTSSVCLATLDSTCLG